MAKQKQTLARKSLVNISAVSRENAESEALFLSIGEGAIVTDERGNVSRINDTALNILGYKREDIIGKWYPAVVVAEDKQGNILSNIERPITQVFFVGKPLFKKLYYRHITGKRIPVALTVAPVMVNGSPIGAIEVFRDITEEVKLENSKDEFISIASHQLRTPATIVKQYLGMLLEGYCGKLSHEQTRVLRTAYENNEHQLETINDLLKVAQADANVVPLIRKDSDLVSLIDEIIQEQQNKYAAKELLLSFKHDEPEIRCMVDPLHIRMVLDNLLDNAYKYSRELTNITVSLSQTSKHVLIKVSDEGVGIGSKDMHKLFKKFSRIDNPLSFSGGTGLGLYWVKKLVILHHGTITVSSKINKGTEFTIKIPFNQDKND